jgi:hypothetical protein
MAAHIQQFVTGFGAFGAGTSYREPGGGDGSDAGEGGGY